MVSKFKWSTLNSHRKSHWIYSILQSNICPRTMKQGDLIKSRKSGRSFLLQIEVSKTTNSFSVDQTDKIWIFRTSGRQNKVIFDDLFQKWFCGNLFLNFVGDLIFITCYPPLGTDHTNKPNILTQRIALSLPFIFNHIQHQLRRLQCHPEKWYTNEQE